jgi:hypothetical protein
MAIGAGTFPEHCDVLFSHFLIGVHSGTMRCSSVYLVSNNRNNWKRGKGGSVE